jgi:hypothetical protein
MIDPNSPIYCKIQPAEGCRNKTFYEVGETYKLDSEPEIGENGFHCCSNFVECLKYLDNKKDQIYFRVQLGTNVKNKFGSLFCSDEICIIEEWDTKKVVESFTKESCLTAVSIFGWMFKYLQEHMKTPEVCLRAVSNYGRMLKHVPEKMKTLKMCRDALLKDGNILKHVPESLKTPEICAVAVSQNEDALKFVPENLKTAEILWTARTVGSYEFNTL